VRLGECSVVLSVDERIFLGHRCCAARKLEPRRDLPFIGISGGARVFVDQAAQDGFSEEPPAVEVGNCEAATVVFTVGDALGDALVRPGRVVVHLVFLQDGAQMAFPEDQHAVQELTAQGYRRGARRSSSSAEPARPCARSWCRRPGRRRRTRQ
jgi:hypothetical protein